MSGFDQYDNQSTLGSGNASTGSSFFEVFDGVKNENIKTETQQIKENTPQEHYELKTWGAQLSKELKENEEAVKVLSKFDDISGLASSYLELEKKLGTMQVIPNDKATKEELDAFYKKLGKPDSSEKYGFKQEDEAEKLLAKAAYEANLSDAQAKQIYDFIYNIGEAQQERFKEFIQKKAQETDALLKKEFGNQAEEKIGNYTKALKAFGSSEVMDQLKETGLAYDTDFVKMFIRIGEALGESRTVIGGGSVNGKGIKSVKDGGSFSFFEK